MALTRRKFLQKLGLVALTAPIIAQGVVRPGAVFASPVEPSKPVPLSEGVAPQPIIPTNAFIHGPEAFGTFDFSQEVVPLNLRYIPATSPSKDDPLGSYGVAGYKFTWDGKQYGNWMKISDLVDNSPGMRREVFQYLVERAQLDLIHLGSKAKVYYSYPF